MYPTLESRSDLLKMLDEITQARQQLLERCSRLTLPNLQNPVYEGTWSLLQNLAHLAWAQVYLLAWIRKRPGLLSREEFPPEPPLDLAAIRTALDESQAAAIAFLKSN